MGLIEQAKKDIEQITSNKSEFAVDITFTAPTGDIVTIAGLHKKHHFGFDPMTGAAVNSKTASISFSEKFLTDLDYPIRNSKNEVILAGHIIDVKDSTGELKRYKVSQWFPDETIGLISANLMAYE